MAITPFNIGILFLAIVPAMMNSHGSPRNVNNNARMLKFFLNSLYDDVVISCCSHIAMRLRLLNTNATMMKIVHVNICSTNIGEYSTAFSMYGSKPHLQFEQNVINCNQKCVLITDWLLMSYTSRQCHMLFRP